MSEKVLATGMTNRQFRVYLLVVSVLLVVLVIGVDLVATLFVNNRPAPPCTVTTQSTQKGIPA